MKHVVAIDAISAPWLAICATSTMEALVTAAPPRTDLRGATRALRRTKKQSNVSLRSGVIPLRTRKTTTPRAFAKIASAHLFTGTPATARVAESRVALRFENHPRHHVSPHPTSALARALSLARDESPILARTFVHERPVRRANRRARRFIQWIGLHRAPIDVRRPRRLRSRLPRLRARRSTRRKFIHARARFHAQNSRARVHLRARARDRAIARVVASRASSRVRRRVRVADAPVDALGVRGRRVDADGRAGDGLRDRVHGVVVLCRARRRGSDHPSDSLRRFATQAKRGSFI